MTKGFTEEYSAKKADFLYPINEKTDISASSKMIYKS